MRSAPGVLRGIAASFLFAATGCVSLGRESPPLEQYVLGGGRSPEGAAASRDGAGLAIGVRRIDLASYLATPAIVVRHGANRIVVSDFHRWAEDVGEGINRLVARHIAAGGAVQAVTVAPWPVRAHHDYLLQLRVTRFEGMVDSLAAEGSVRVTAAWEVIHPEDGTVAARGWTDYQRGGWRVSDYAALVVMLEAGLEELATDVLGCLTRVRFEAAASAGADPGRASPAVPAPCSQDMRPR
jgi:uncharacterized lipoprotein YmbA